MIVFYICKPKDSEDRILVGGLDPDPGSSGQKFVVLGENHFTIDVHIRLLSPPNHITKDHDETCI